MTMPAKPGYYSVFVKASSISAVTAFKQFILDCPIEKLELKAGAGPVIRQFMLTARYADYANNRCTSANPCGLG